MCCLCFRSLSSLCISLSHPPHQTKCSLPKKPSCRISKGNRCDRLTNPAGARAQNYKKKWSMSTSGVLILSCDTHLHVCAPVLRPDGHRCWTHALGCICLPQLWPWHKLQRSRPKVNVGLWDTHIRIWTVLCRCVRRAFAEHCRIYSALPLTSAGMGFLWRVLPADRKESKTLCHAQVGLQGLWINGNRCFYGDLIVKREVDWLVFTHILFRWCAKTGELVTGRGWVRENNTI